MPASFRHHFVGKSLRNVCYRDVAFIFIRLIGNDHRDIVVDQMIQIYLNSAINLRPLTPHIVIVYPQNGDRFVATDSVTSPPCV